MKDVKDEMEMPLMRRDITYIQGVQMEEAVEIIRHCFFDDDEMELVEREIRSKEEFRNAYRDLIKYWKFEHCISEMHAYTGNETFYYYGNCKVCNSPQPFIVDYQSAEMEEGRKTLNWRERLVCPNCGCNSRQRFIIHKIFDSYISGMNIVMYECKTNVFKKVQREIPEVKGFEYPGESYMNRKIVKEIPCEDIYNLSFADEEIDFLIANDVFETAYNYRQAFQEAYRVLKPGGKLLFTVPFDGNSDTITRRAEHSEHGLVYIQDKWYHKNPIEGAKPLLVYQIFGWDILKDLKECGFSDAYGKVYYDLKAGYMGYLPLYFEVCK